MANLYGVANAPGQPFFAGTIGAANVNCPTGVVTPVFTSPTIIAPSQGYFYVAAWFYFQMVMGATPPTGIFYGIQIGAGSAIFNTSSAGPFTANGNYQLGGAEVTPASQVAWVAPGSTITISMQCVGGSGMVTYGGSYAMSILMRAVDQ